MDREARYALIAQQQFSVVDRSKGRTSRSFVATSKEIWANRSMLMLLVRRDLKSRYKDSALGFLWTLARPITQLIIYAVVIGKFLGAERGIPLFAIYIFTGLTIFTLFQEIVGGGTGSIVGNSGLVKKVYVPREIFPLASLGTAIFNFLIQFVVLMVALVIFDNVHFSLQTLYIFPSILVVIVYGLGLAFFLSAANVYLRDVGYIVEIVLMVLMWASPILYSWTMVRDALAGASSTLLLDIYTNNPITLAVIGFQKAIYGTSIHGIETPPGIGLSLIVALLIGIVFLYISQRVFSRLQGNFAQEL